MLCKRRRPHGMPRGSPLTEGPFRVLTMRVRLSSQFSHHLVETLDRIRYAVYRFETFTYDLVYRDPGKCELQTNSVNPTTGARAKGDTYTNSRKQDVFPQVTGQFYFHPLS